MHQPRSFPLATVAPLALAFALSAGACAPGFDGGAELGGEERIGEGADHEGADHEGADHEGAGSAASATETPTALVDVAASAGSAAVRAAGVGLTVQAVAQRRSRDGELWITVRGRTTRNLAAVASYVPDDGFGDARLVGKRTFEIDLRGGHEVNSILSGLPLFVHLEMAAGPTPQLDALLELRPSLAGGDGAVTPILEPVYTRDAVEPLRYRARAFARTVTRAVPEAEVRAEADGTIIDWRYDALGALLQEQQPEVRLEGEGLALRAAAGVRVTRVGLTSLGVTAAWPEATCAPQVFRCMGDAPKTAVDLTACGSYREVARCAFADACEVLGAPQPLSLAPMDSELLRLDEGAPQSLVAAAAAAFQRAGGSAGEWRSVTAVRGFRYPSCVAAEPSLEALGAELEVALEERLDYGDGVVTPRRQLSSLPFFRGAAGRDLLAALDAVGGDTQAEARVFSLPVPCPNCTESWVRVVLVYRATRAVVVLDGTYGYES